MFSLRVRFTILLTIHIEDVTIEDSLHDTNYFLSEPVHILFNAL